jgi:hypothetical protein
MVKTPGPQPTGSAVTADPAMNQLKFALTAGIYPTSPPPTSTIATSTTSTFPDSGANSIWNTKVGTVAINIDCDFALTSAQMDNTPIGGTSSLTSVLTPTGTAAPAFYSKPMHATALDSITSVLTISVWLLSPADQTTKVSPMAFQGTFILKSVPTAVWAAYDPAADPATTAVPVALTTPDSPTVTLAMGVSLLPPERDATPSSILPFDASTAFEESLGQWPLPPLVAEQNVLLAGGQVDATATPAQQWAQVASDWTTFAGKGEPVLGGGVAANGTPGPGLLALAAQTLGWNVPTPSGAVGTQTPASGTGAGSGTTPTTPSWLLNGEIPDLLIANLSTQYPVLPRYSASGAAGGS